LEAAKKKTPSLVITVVQNLPNSRFPSEDSDLLFKKGVISEIVNINLKQGVQHAKFIITDDTSKKKQINQSDFYLGSANMDWRALSQVKEMGIYVKSCPCMANDLSKIYGIWSYLGKSLNSTAAMGYPTQFDTIYNEKTPIHLNDKFNGSVFHLSSSPGTINSQFRSTELTSLLNHIRAAKRFVYISVMDYVPFEIYGSSSSYTYWGELDDAMKSAVARGVDVNLLVSKWNSTKSQMYIGLENLQNFARFCLPSQNYQWCKGNMTVKLMELPSISI
jgi:phospholipase D3/4